MDFFLSQSVCLSVKYNKSKRGKSAERDEAKGKLPVKRESIFNIDETLGN